MNLVKYFQEAKSELKKVKWPSRKSAWNYTLVVIAITGVTAIYLGALDLGFNRVFEWVIELT